MTATAPSLQSSSEWYTIEFTSVYTTWLREQLGKLLLPGVDTIRMPAAGALKVPGGSKGPGGVLGDESSRTRWLQKWEYR
jgi:mediator of RNA polymerase II transcription subunit 12